MALCSRSARQPKPSSTIRMRKGRRGMGRRRYQTLRGLGLLLAFEDHADVVRRAGLEVDGRDAHQLPSVVAEAVELFGAARIHRVILRPDVDDLVFPEIGRA